MSHYLIYFSLLSSNYYWSVQMFSSKEIGSLIYKHCLWYVGLGTLTHMDHNFYTAFKKDLAQFIKVNTIHKSHKEYHRHVSQISGQFHIRTVYDIRLTSQPSITSRFEAISPSERWEGYIILLIITNWIKVIKSSGLSFDEGEYFFLLPV
jgi:hypothetical protein